MWICRGELPFMMQVQGFALLLAVKWRFFIWVAVIGEGVYIAVTLVLSDELVLWGLEVWGEMEKNLQMLGAELQGGAESGIGWV